MNESEIDIPSTAIIAVNIKYSPRNFRGKKKPDTEENYPSSVILDLPERILNQREKPNYMDIIESFVYNTISGKYEREVDYCQIYLQ